MGEIDRRERLADQLDPGIEPAAIASSTPCSCSAAAMPGRICTTACADIGVV